MKDHANPSPTDALMLLLRDESELRAACERSGISMDRARKLRDGLVHAIAPELPSSSGGRWTQVAVPITNSADAVAFFSSPIGDTMSHWTKSGLASHAFFVRKPPGILIRVELENPDDVGQVFDELLSALPARGHILPPNRSGEYLPESFLFGGAAGMELAHGFFTLDSIGVLQYLQAGSRPEFLLGPTEFSLLLLIETFGHLVADDWEHWDVWCRFDTTGRLLAMKSPARVTEETPRPDSAQAWIRARFRGEPAPLSDVEHRIMSDVRRSIGLLQAKVHEMRFEMDVPMRQVLPFWAAFHWNRMGFDLTTQRVLARLVVDSCAPHGQHGRTDSIYLPGA